MYEPTDLTTLDASNVRIIAVDMDGTLLNDAKELPDGLWDTIRALRVRGIEFVPASGRQYWTLRDLFAPVADGMTIIGENGSIVMKDGVELFMDGIDCDTAVAIAKRIRDMHAQGVDTGMVACCAKSGYVERADTAFNTTVREFYHRTQIVPDLAEHVAKMRTGEVDDTLLKVAQWADGGIAELSLQTMGPHIDTHQRVVSGANWVDLQERTVNKGMAIAALQERLGVTPMETMAFGDFNNDVEMMQRAHFSFAMSNAVPEVHAVSNYVAPSNNDNGVMTVVRKLFGVD